MDSEFLVADIGGTNVRFAIANIDENLDIQLNDVNMYPTENWLYLEDAVNDYLAQVGKRVKKASIAFAGPVNKDEVSMTNGTWQFNQSELASYLHMEEVIVMNDYYAHACSMPILKDDQLIKIGGGESIKNGNMVVLGPGTGVGVGAIVSVGEKWKAVASEGGHIGFSPSGALEKEIFKIIADDYNRVSIEELMSGRGLSYIHFALGKIKGLDQENKKGQTERKKYLVTCLLTKFHGLLVIFPARMKELITTKIITFLRPLCIFLFLLLGLTACGILCTEAVIMAMPIAY